MPIFTFGSGHMCPQCKHPLHRAFIELPSRDVMVALFGIKWSHEYKSQREAGVERFYLQRIRPGTCACGETRTCIGCGVVLELGNLCDKCDRYEDVAP
jgi:hypothetical protein